LFDSSSDRLPFHLVDAAAVLVFVRVAAAP